MISQGQLKDSQYNDRKNKDKHWVETSAGGLLVHDVIKRPVVNVSVLTWFIRYNVHRNLHFLSHVIIINTKVRSIFAILFRHFSFLAPNDFQIFWLALSVLDEG